MTVPFWCLFVASLMPIVLAWVGGYFRVKQFKYIDNHHPRIQSAQLEGAGARAITAQNNAWEALIVFTGAVLVSHIAGADAAKAAWAAQIFIGARVLYAICYIVNQALLRSLFFTVGLGCCIWLYLMAAWA